VEKSLRVIELARDFDDLYTEVSARYFAAQALVTIGDSEGILKDSAALLDAAERLRNHHLLGSALFTIGTVAFVRGEWEVARGYIDRGLAISPQDPRLLTTRILLEYEEGAPGWGETYLAQFLQVMNSTSPGPVWEYAYIALVMTLAARITNTTDHLDVAEAAAATVLSSPSATPLYAGVARAALGLLASLRLDVAAASEHYVPLELIRGTIPSRIITVDRVLGLLAQTMGKLDVAVAHFEEALTFCRRAGYKPEYAWSCHD
jgi:tetratricopeptide (TPR) repeat protein